MGGGVIEDRTQVDHELLVGRVVRPEREDSAGCEVPVEFAEAVGRVEHGVGGIQLVARRVVDVEKDHRVRHATGLPAHEREKVVLDQ